MKMVLKNIKLKILALLCAIMFWVFIMGIQNTFYKFPEKVPVQPFNLATGLSVVNDLGTVELTIDTGKEDVKNLGVKDFTAYVDLQSMGVGESTAEILVTSKNTNVNILKSTPNKIDVVIEEVDMKTVPLRHLLKGDPKEGYEISNVEMSKEEITITGAKSATKEAIEGIVIFSLDGTEIGDTVKKGSVEIVDINENKIENLQVEEGDIEAEIQVKQISETKTVGIEPSFIGELEDGWVKKITLNPQTVIIKGSAATLSKIETVKTDKIDLRAISGTSIIKVPLNLPGDIETSDGVKEIRVTLEIETEK